MKRVALLATFALWPVLWPIALEAQDTDQADRDRSYLTGLIEDNLSGLGREVRIEGFRGALSSRAQFDLMTIADDDGIWLTLRDGVLDWNRGALLKGQIEVDELSVGSIDLPRLPSTGKTGPDTTASTFSLPDLPVSVQIGSLSVDQANIGAPVLGEDAQFSLQGNASLASGEGSAALELSRTDGKLGEISAEGSYANATDTLSLDLALREGPEGIFVKKVALPGLPAVSFTAQGNAPLSDYTARIALATDGQERLAGDVTLTTVQPETIGESTGETTGETIAPEEGPQGPSRRFSADLSGDITPLFAVDYAKFFGRDVSFQVQGEYAADGALNLERLALSAQALNMTGALSVGNGGLPTAFNLAATLGTEDGNPVLLPLTGPKTYVTRALIQARYDSTEGKDWVLDAALDNFKRDAFAIATAIMRGKGEIGPSLSKRGNILVNSVTADIGFDVLGLNHTDTALQTALGRNLSGQVLAHWGQGQPITIDRLLLDAGDVDLDASADIDGLSGGFFTGFNAKIDAADLSRFAPLVGQKGLKGNASLTADGIYQPLGGSLDVQAQGSGTSIGIGIDALDRLIVGNADFAIDVARTQAGTDLRKLTLSTPAISSEISGSINEEVSSFTLDTRLDNLGRIAEGINGPASATGTASRVTDGPWQVDFNATGPGGSDGTIRGTLTTDPTLTVEMTAAGTAPLGLVNTFVSGVTVQGPVRYDLAMSGRPSIEAITGRVTTQGARVSLPDLGSTLKDLAVTADLSGGRAALTLSTNVAEGGAITMQGGLGLTAPYAADLTAQLNEVAIRDPELYRTRISGTLALQGPLTAGATIRGGLTIGRTEVRVPSSGLGGSGDFPDVIHIAEPADVRQTRIRANALATNGDSGRSGGALGLDITIAAPNQIFVRGRGLDAELGGQIQLTGTTTNIVPVGQFSLVRGRLDILGKRLDLSEGTLVAQGAAQPVVRLVATTETTDAQVQVVIEGPVDDIGVRFTSSPQLPDDEILARLLFGRALTEITPLQAAQMASAVATLAGKGGEGVIGRLRKSFGLDDLDVTTTDEGDAALKLGKYVTDNIYTEVIVDSTGKSEINLNLDITDNVTAKGKLGSDGETGLGVFFERDY